MALSRWMRAARAAEGGLLVPGRSQRSACDLLLHPDGVRVSSGDLAVELPYTAPDVADDDSWSIGAWTYTRGGGGIGVGVVGAGRFAAPVAGLRRRHRTVAHLVDRIADRSDVAPLCTARTVDTRVDADRDALTALCRGLTDRPEWRPQLRDPARVTQLLRDLANQDHASVPPWDGFRRRAMETSVAMRLLGFEHPTGGRPMPDSARADAEDVVGAVVRRLAANRYALAVDETYTRAMVHRHYLDISPWPFAAMLPDPAAGSGGPPAR